MCDHTLQLDEEVLVISGIRSKCDPWHRVGLNGFGLFDDARTGTLHFVDTLVIINNNGGNRNDSLISVNTPPPRLSVIFIRERSINGRRSGMALC